MSVDDEIRKTVEAAVERALEKKDNGRHPLPILALLVGAPLFRSRENMLIDTLLGVALGASVDRGDDDRKILAACQSLLTRIRAGLADPMVHQQVSALKKMIPE